MKPRGSRGVVERCLIRGNSEAGVQGTGYEALTLKSNTIVDNVTGIYVPPGDAGALRAAIQRMLASPADRRRIGQAARAFIEKEAGLDLFTDKCVAAMKDAHAARFGSA